MLAAVILKAMKDNHKVQEPDNSSDSTKHQTYKEINISQKDISSNHGTHTNPGDASEGFTSQQNEILEQNRSPKETETKQNTQDDTTGPNSEPIMTSKNTSDNHQNPPLNVESLNQGVATHRVHFENKEHKERPKDLVSLFKRSSDFGSETGSLTNSPKLKGSHFKRSAVATMKRVRDKISITKLFLNMTRKPSENPGTYQQWDPSMGSKISWTLKKEIKTFKDAEYIYESIKNFPFFSRFVAQTLDEAEEMAILHICRSMKYETLPAGHYVFKEGDPSNDKFYIVLSGRVSVVLKSDSNVFVHENRGRIQEEKQITKPGSKGQLREPESPVNLLQEEDSRSSKQQGSDKESSSLKSLTSLNSTSPTSSLTSIPTHSIRKLSIFARSVARFSAIPKKKNEVIQETEEEHKQKIKDEVDRLREIASKAAEGKKMIKRESSDKRKKSIRKSSKKKDTQTLKPELGVINKEIKEGESFGERALTSKEAKRSASILTNTDCEFIVVMKKDYVNIMGRYNKEDRLKMEYLKKNLPYVDKISSSSVLQDYLYIFHTELLHRGNTVLEEGSQGERVYMLVHGEIKFEKKMEFQSIFDCTKTTKTVTIANLSAPAIFGEEILFDQKNYKYTVKVESQSAKLYYCSVDSLKIRFPKETLNSLRESYEAKEDFHNNRIEFMKTSEKQTLSQAQSSESFQADKLIDYCYRDLLNFAASSSRTGLINRFRAIPDQLLNLRSGNSPDELEERKESFKDYTRNVSNIRQHILQESQKEIDDFYSADFREKTTTKSKKNRPETSKIDNRTKKEYSPEPQVTRESVKINRKEVLDEKQDTSKSDTDSSQQENLELEFRKFERTNENKTPSPLSERRTRTETNSPDKLIANPARKNSLFLTRTSKAETQGDEMITVITPRTANLNENEENKPGQSKRRYIIRHMKRSQNQEELLRNMQNFEEKLSKLIKENKDNAAQLQIYDFELPGHHHGHRQALSWNGNSATNTSPTYFDNSNHFKDPILSNSPANFITNTTNGFLSDKLNSAKSASDVKRTEISSRNESRQLTKRLIHSLHIKKDSDLHLHLANFSNQLYGIIKKEKPKELELNSVKKQEPILSPKHGVTTPQYTQASDNFSVVPMIKLASYVANKSSKTNVYQGGSQTTREPSLRESLTAREQPQKIKKKSVDKFNSTNNGSFTPNKLLLAKKKERVALDSFKKIRVINHMYETSMGKFSQGNNFAQTKLISVNYVKSISKS